MPACFASPRLPVCVFSPSPRRHVIANRDGVNRLGLSNPLETPAEKIVRRLIPHRWTKVYLESPLYLVPGDKLLSSPGTSTLRATTVPVDLFSPPPDLNLNFESRYADRAKSEPKSNPDA